MLPPGWFHRLRIMYPRLGAGGAIRRLVERVLREADQIDEYGRLKDADGD